MATAKTKDGVILIGPNRIQWTATCPACGRVLRGEDRRNEWLIRDPVCDQCGLFFAGLSNPHFVADHHKILGEGVST